MRTLTLNPPELLEGWDPRTWIRGDRITPIYKPFSWPFGRGRTTLSLGDNNDHHGSHLQVMG